MKLNKAKRLPLNANVPNTSRLNVVLIVLLVITICAGLSILSATVISASVLNGILAILLLTAAIVLPMRQKRFLLYSPFLIASAILFLLSGAIDNAYHAVVSPLSILKQIEFSKIVRPAQLSRGLSNLGFGFLYFLVAFAGFHFSKLPEKSKSKLIKFSLVAMVIFGILFSISGITSIVEGLRKL